MYACCVLSIRWCSCMATYIAYSDSFPEISHVPYVSDDRSNTRTAIKKNYMGVFYRTARCISTAHTMHAVNWINIVTFVIRRSTRRAAASLAVARPGQILCSLDPGSCWVRPRQFMARTCAAQLPPSSLQRSCSVGTVRTYCVALVWALGRRTEYSSSTHVCALFLRTGCADLEWDSIDRHLCFPADQPSLACPVRETQRLGVYPLTQQGDIFLIYIVSMDLVSASLYST